MLLACCIQCTTGKKQQTNKHGHYEATTILYNRNDSISNHNNLTFQKYNSAFLEIDYQEPNCVLFTVHCHDTQDKTLLSAHGSQSGCRPAAFKKGTFSFILFFINL